VFCPFASKHEDLPMAKVKTSEEINRRRRRFSPGESRWIAHFAQNAVPELDDMLTRVTGRH
jgi:hypothetical protein